MPELCWSSPHGAPVGQARRRLILRDQWSMLRSPGVKWRSMDGREEARDGGGGSAKQGAVELGAGRPEPVPRAAWKLSGCPAKAEEGGISKNEHGFVGIAQRQKSDPTAEIFRRGGAGVSGSSIWGEREVRGSPGHPFIAWIRARAGGVAGSRGADFSQNSG